MKTDCNIGKFEVGSSTGNRTGKDKNLETKSGILNQRLDLNKWLQVTDLLKAWFSRFEPWWWFEKLQFKLDRANHKRSCMRKVQEKLVTGQIMEISMGLYCFLPATTRKTTLIHKHVLDMYHRWDTIIGKRNYLRQEKESAERQL